jgi:hypothetical protein
MITPGRHRPLAQEAWNESAVRVAIEEIVADAIAHFDPDTFWPAHPSDDGTGDGDPSFYKGAVFRRSRCSKPDHMIPNSRCAANRRHSAAFKGAALRTLVGMSAADQNEPSKHVRCHGSFRRKRPRRLPPLRCVTVGHITPATGAPQRPDATADGGGACTGPQAAASASGHAGNGVV